MRGGGGEGGGGGGIVVREMGKIRVEIKSPPFITNVCVGCLPLAHKVTCYLSSLCLVAHKASTECFQFSLLAEAALASSHVRHPALFLSRLFYARWS